MPGRRKGPCRVGEALWGECAIFLDASGGEKVPQLRTQREARVLCHRRQPMRGHSDGAPQRRASRLHRLQFSSRQLYQWVERRPRTQCIQQAGSLVAAVPR